MPRPLLYTILQVPGVLVTGALLYLAWQHGWVGRDAAILLLLLWLTKDVVMYPFVAAGLAQGPGRLVGPETLVGQLAIVETPLDPRGVVGLKGERWSAETRVHGEPVPSGARVRVEAVRNLVLLVAPVTALPPQVPPEG